MGNRRNFLIQSSLFVAGSAFLPDLIFDFAKVKNLGVQLYSFRNAMSEDARGTLEIISELGFKQIESARSSKGHYYGLSPDEIKQVCSDLGLTLRSGHVHLDDNWQKTMEDAARAGQEYLICSTMPSKGQTLDNYKKVAEAFNKAGEECQKMGLKFGYHNHEYEFEEEGGEVLYDVLMDNTEAKLVHMELDLGWVIVGGKDPLDYFNKYKGRFPLWHLKDMDMSKKESTELGKGGLDVKTMLDNRKSSGAKHIFIEQEEYASTPYESMKANINYLKQL